MKRFYVLLFGLLVTVYGFCQEPDPTDRAYILPTVAEDVVSVEDRVYSESEDILRVSISDEPRQEVEEAQCPDSPETAVAHRFDYKESKYWGRYTALRTAGWISLGVGIGFCIGGYSMLFAAVTTGGADALGVAGGLMFFSSPLFVVASIPLLACAYYNRHKAKKMYLNVGASLLPSGRLTPLKTSTPALSFSLAF